MIEKNKKRIINLPNFLTLLRFLMIAVMVWFFLRDELLNAMYVFMLAVSTDFLDGYIARKLDLVTNLGKLIDPLADKLLQIAAMFCFYWVGYLPIGAFILIVLNEVLMVYGASFLFLRKHTIVSANLFGKIAAGLFYCAILSTFLHKYTNPYDMWAIFICIALLYTSLAQYWYIQLRNQKREKNAKTDNSYI